MTPSFSAFQRLFRLSAVMMRNYMAVFIPHVAVNRNWKPILRSYRVSRRDIQVSIFSHYNESTTTPEYRPS